MSIVWWLENELSEMLHMQEITTRRLTCDFVIGFDLIWYALQSIRHQGETASPVGDGSQGAC